MSIDAALLADYVRLRNVSDGMGEELLGRAVRDCFQEAARELGLWENGRAQISSEAVATVIVDFAMYDVRRSGRNVIGQALAEKIYHEGSQELTQLLRMSKSWYSLFTILEIVPEKGFKARDVIRQADYVWIDRSLSRTAKVGDMLASRVIPCEGFIMSSGAILPLALKEGGHDKFQAGIVKLVFGENVAPPKRLSDEQEHALAKTLILVGLGSGATDRVRYALAGKHVGSGKAAMEFATPSRPVGRNDPCHCKSGRKFKRCCGRA